MRSGDAAAHMREKAAIVGDALNLLARVKQLTEENEKWRERVNVEHAALQECMEHEVQRVAERDAARGIEVELGQQAAETERRLQRQIKELRAENYKVMTNWKTVSDQVRALRAAADGVRALHRPTGPPDSGKTCIEDGDEWPCRTVAALAAAGAPEPQPPKPLVPPIDWSKVSQKRAP